MPILRNLVGQTSTTTGTGDRALDGSALANARTFASAYTAGDVVSATIVDRITGDTECGTYTVRDSPSRLEVVAIRLAFGPNASGPTSPIDFAAGTRDAFVDLQAEDAITADDVATASTASKIPRAGSDGTLAREWIPGFVGGGVSIGSFVWGLPGEYVPTATSTTHAVSGSNRLIGHGFTAHASVTLTHAAFEVTAAAAAGGVGEMVLYDATVNADGSYTPTTRIAVIGAGTPINSTGLKSVSGLSIPLVRGRAYWAGLAVSLTCTVRACRVHRMAGRIWDGGTSGQGAVTVFLASSAYPAPDPAPAVAPAASSSASNLVVFFQW